MNNVFVYKTIIGDLVIEDDGDSIVRVSLLGEEEVINNFNETKLIKEAHKQLNEYFEGKRMVFNLPINPIGTEFQKSVWKALRNIPYGETRSYKEIAMEIGKEKAARAVGMANNKNKIIIIIPCHRVVGANGNLVGFNAGIWAKRELLKIEGNNKYKNGI